MPVLVVSINNSPSNYATESSLNDETVLSSLLCKYLFANSSDS